MDIRFPPRRVISLVPSITEYLLDIGVEVVGRTKFCIHPSEKTGLIPVVGGTKNFRFEAIHALAPDLIIGNKEENYPEGIEELSHHFPVWMSDIQNLEDARGMMTTLGEVLDVEDAADQVVGKVDSLLERLKKSQKGSVLYLIWQNPWMAAGTCTYIHSFLEHLGYHNVLDKERYPILTDQQLADLRPDKILLSSEPFPFGIKHQEMLQAILPHTEVSLVDGEAFSWYGSRILKSGW